MQQTPPVQLLRHDTALSGFASRSVCVLHIWGKYTVRVAMHRTHVCALAQTWHSTVSFCLRQFEQSRRIIWGQSEQSSGTIWGQSLDNWGAIWGELDNNRDEPQRIWGHISSQNTRALILLFLSFLGHWHWRLFLKQMSKHWGLNWAWRPGWVHCPCAVQPLPWEPATSISLFQYVCISVFPYFYISQSEQYAKTFKAWAQRPGWWVHRPCAPQPVVRPTAVTSVPTWNLYFPYFVFCILILCLCSVFWAVICFLPYSAFVDLSSCAGWKEAMVVVAAPGSATNCRTEGADNH